MNRKFISPATGIAGRGIGISGLILIVFLIGLISADFTIGEASHSITKEYASNTSIAGWANISLENELLNSVLECFFDGSSGGSINLIDLLKKSSNADFDYTCDPVSCSSYYQADNLESSKTFDLNEDDSVLFGFKISSTEIFSDVLSFSFDLTSNNEETENFPLAIDILDDGENEWNAYESSGNFGSEYLGCYAGIEGSTTNAKIIQILYCEKIELSQTPEVEIGAYIDFVGEEGEEDVSFTLSIERKDTGESSSCETTATGSGADERIACIPENFHINEDGEYHVCIRTADSEDANKYEIAYEQTNPCGFTGSYNEIYNYDFEIFAKPAKYASEIGFILNNEELANSGNSIIVEPYIEDYISDMYDNDCSEGCVIPVKIYSGVSQQIDISNALIQFFAGIQTETEDIYDIEESPAEINSGFQKLYFNDAGFKTPSEYDTYDFSVELNGEELFSDKINVTEAAFDIKSLSPTTTGVKYPTKFKVKVSSNRNITKYVWDFGDGSSVKTTTINETIHTYDGTGNYTIGITVSDKEGMSFSKNFNVSVAPASELVPVLLTKADISITNIKTEIETFSSFEQKSINEVLKLDELEAEIIKLKDDASQATSEESYELILGSLLEMKIPQSAAKIISSEEMEFYPEADNLDLDILKKIGGGEYESGKEDKYQEAILAWDVENADAILSYSEIFIIYENEDTALKIFDFNINNKNSDSYFIIKDMENLLFEKEYDEKNSDGYMHIELKEGETNIVFSTTEDVDFVSLPAFISPAISSLTLKGEWSPFEKTGELKKWVFFTILVAVILFVALIIWGILQLWYKRKYENYLFKNRNNLYNLVNFISIEKKKGMSEGDIRKRLKKSGWNSEQLRYAFRKYEGKSTGLPELISMGGIFGGFGKKEKKKLPNRS